MRRPVPVLHVGQDVVAETMERGFQIKGVIRKINSVGRRAGAPEFQVGTDRINQHQMLFFDDSY